MTERPTDLPPAAPAPADGAHAAAPAPADGAHAAQPAPADGAHAAAPAPADGAHAAQPAPTLRILLALAGPLVLARATQAVIGAADTYQISHLGPEAVAATATGGLNTYGVMMIPLGTVFIVSSFVAQLRGKGQLQHTIRYAWYGLALAAIAGLTGALAVPFADVALGWFGFEPGVQAQMSTYVGIRLYAVAAIVGMEALGNWYGGLGNTWMQMVGGVIAMIANVALNWVLIDGNLGAPAMGVAGAALASSLASTIGFLFLLGAFLARRGGVPVGSGGRLSLHELARVFRFGAPNGVNWFMEFAAFQLFVNVVLAGLGTATLAAFNVVLSINMVSFMPAFGLATAGSILAGASIGAGQREQVWPTVKLTLLSAGAFMGFIGAVYALLPRPILSLFARAGDYSVVEIGAVMLVLSAGWQLFDAVGLTLSETLRAAGDTTWTAVARLVLAWLVFIPVSLWLMRDGGGGAVEAMLCLAGYIALVAAALGYRFASGGWKRITLIEPTLV
ncbi:MAG: MATE family efflux transporter [Kofleriaceae bacterium]